MIFVMSNNNSELVRHLIEEGYLKTERIIGGIQVGIIRRLSFADRLWPDNFPASDRRFYAGAFTTAGRR
ncbi:MAG: hypothetical protein UV72_C0026G0002 [Candidatus Giovannonibacteria bacterium GW2011_GWB1_43_13]|nr:MAG: hypothetical protein UV72_C0026G0002 [Candidatus Giovannonibacteria bacterium GW2011_GWB1_43_13]